MDGNYKSESKKLEKWVPPQRVDQPLGVEQL